MSTYEHRYESPDGKAVYIQQFCLDSSSTISTNATCSDNPGPGRVLDNLFQFLGRKLELAVGKIAHKAGYGPDALSKKLAEEVVQSIKEWEERWKGYKTETLDVELSGKGRKLSERLMKHVHSDAQSTQMKALAHIASLATSFPAVRAAFRAQGVEQLLHSIPQLFFSQHRFPSSTPAHQIDFLLAPSRRALFCIEESGINEAATQVSQLRAAEHCPFALADWQLRDAVGLWKSKDVCKTAVAAAENVLRLLSWYKKAQARPDLQALAMEYMELFVNGMRVYKRSLLRDPQAMSVVFFGDEVISCDYPAPSWSSGLGTDFISIRLKSPWESCTAITDGEQTSEELKDMFELDMHFYFRTHLESAKDNRAIANAVEQVTKDIVIEMHALSAERIQHFTTSTRFDLMRLYRKSDGGLVLDGRMHIYVDLQPLQLPWDIIFQDTVLITDVMIGNEDSYTSNFLPAHTSYPRYDWVPNV